MSATRKIWHADHQKKKKKELPLFLVYKQLTRGKYKRFIRCHMLWSISGDYLVIPSFNLNQKTFFSPTFLWSMHNGQKSKSAGHNAKENWKPVLMVDFYLKLWKIVDFDLFLFQVWTSNRNIFNEIFIFGPNCLHEKHNTVKTAVKVFFFFKVVHPSFCLSIQPSVE